MLLGRPCKGIEICKGSMTFAIWGARCRRVRLWRGILSVSSPALEHKARSSLDLLEICMLRMGSVDLGGNCTSPSFRCPDKNRGRPKLDAENIDPQFRG